MSTCPDLIDCDELSPLAVSRPIVRVIGMSPTPLSNVFGKHCFIHPPLHCVRAANSLSSKDALSIYINDDTHVISESLRILPINTCIALSGSSGQHKVFNRVAEIPCPKRFERDHASCRSSLSLGPSHRRDWVGGAAVFTKEQAFTKHHNSRI